MTEYHLTLDYPSMLAAKDDEIARLDARISVLEAQLSAKLSVTDYGEGFEEGLAVQAARIAELEAENAKFRAMYDEQLLMAVKVSAALEKKND